MQQIKYGMFGWNGESDFFQASNLTASEAKDVATTMDLSTYQLVPMNGSDYPNAQFVCYVRNEENEASGYDRVRLYEWLTETYHYASLTPPS
jgi:hypothetical protein